MCNFIDPQVFRRADGARVSGQYDASGAYASHGALDAPDILAGGPTTNVYGFLDAAYQYPVLRN